jgi:hypothetical protein
MAERMRWKKLRLNNTQFKIFDGISIIIAEKVARFYNFY